MTGIDDHARLADSIKQLDSKVERKFRAVSKAIHKTERDIMLRLQPVHDFMIDQQGFFRGQQHTVKDKDISTTKELIKIITILAGVIVALAGIYQVTK